MICGIGVDVVDLERFARALDRTPRLRDRLFAESERALPARSLAARFAGKEALIKALGGSDGVGWHDLAITVDADGAPAFAAGPTLRAAYRARGAARAHLSLSHDAGIAIGFVVLEDAP